MIITRRKLRYGSPHYDPANLVMELEFVHRYGRGRGRFGSGYECHPTLRLWRYSFHRDRGYYTLHRDRSSCDCHAGGCFRALQGIGRAQARRFGNRTVLFSEKK